MTQSDPINGSDVFLMEELLTLYAGPEKVVGVEPLLPFWFQQEAERWRDTVLMILIELTTEAK